MIRIAIAEDEASSLKFLKECIERYEEECGQSIEVKTFSDGIEIVSSYKPIYDIIFMDIEMPHLDGMAAAKKIREVDSEVCLIFITNMAQYAINGYEVNAFDYIIKPISYYDFVFKMNKVVSRILKRIEKHILLSTEAGLKRVPISQIYYIEVMNHRLYYHTEHGEYKLKGSLTEVEEELKDQSFIRCNSCYLVNLRYVTEIYKNTVIVGGQELQISRLKRKMFLHAVTEYIGELR